MAYCVNYHGITICLETEFRKRFCEIHSTYICHYVEHEHQVPCWKYIAEYYIFAFMIKDVYQVPSYVHVYVYTAYCTHKQIHVQQCQKHLESREITLSSEAGPRCGCKTKGLCTQSEITYTIGTEDILLQGKMTAL